MKTIGILIIGVGIVIAGIGAWKNKNPGGPIFIGNATDSIKELYGVRKHSNWPIVIGLILSLIGISLVILN